MTKPAVRRIGDGRVPEQDLLGREATRIRLAEPGPYAEEGHLEAERRAGIVLYPAGDVPPLDAVIGVRAFVPGKLQFDAGHDRRIGDLGTQRDHCEQEKDECQDQDALSRPSATLSRPSGTLSRQGRERAGVRAPCTLSRQGRERVGVRAPLAGDSPCNHQSSFTARTTSSPIAWRPLTAEVNAAAATSTPLSTASSPQGTCTSMVQWNDCRFTT